MHKMSYTIEKANASIARIWHRERWKWNWNCAPKKYKKRRIAERAVNFRRKYW